MKSIYQFIVEPVGDRRYNNTKDIGGIDFVVNTSEEDFRFSNREAVVLSTPISYSGPIKEGDIVLVHHNVFKFYNDMYGRRKSGKSFLKENIFLLDLEQFFAYKRDGNWVGVDKFCFVKPVPKEDTYIYKPTTHEPLVGEMTILNQTLKEAGIKVGDRVCFKPDSEYEFHVDGELMYRLYDQSVTLTL